MRIRSTILLGLLLSACHEAGTTAADGGTIDLSVSEDASTGSQDLANAVDLADPLDLTVLDGPPPSGLPIPFSRPDVGNPLTAAELTTATDELIAILKDTRYLQFVEERTHGWPESDPAHAYWYGTWWSGIALTKLGGKVTYKHSADGADNNGIHTSPYLESACYAQLLWGDAASAHLVRKLSRGMSAWILAMVRMSGDTNPTLLSRAFYPTSVDSTDGGRMLRIDYDASRPGVDAPPSDYVHLPTNPSFGDVYVKNRRSKDDIGHMLRAIAQVRACLPRLDAAGQADLNQLATLYRSWAARVDASGFVIETLDKSLQLQSPSDVLARYTLAANLECLGALAVRMGGGAPAGTLDCGDGLPGGESLAWTFLKNDARQIQRTHHTAALVESYRIGALTTSASLIAGLAKRIDLDFNLAIGGSPPSGFTPEDVAAELLYASNAGVPLTSREVRWLHERLHQAYIGMRNPSQAATFDTFNAATPDGTYSFDPPSAGLFHRDLGLMLGSCASEFRNPTARPLLDCAALRNATL